MLDRPHSHAAPEVRALATQEPSLNPLHRFWFSS
jgi:hypothetical protein